MRVIVFLFILLIMYSCSVKKTTTYQDFMEHFNNMDSLHKYWEDDSQNGSPKNYDFDNDYLRMISRANTKDRVKIKTKNYFSCFPHFFITKF